ncbi:MAG: hypothetical protein JXR69_05395 [Candidatus Delongbacteria bacterium]|nr:hypothetical protein [Candidatus Delongbacteria bacterium]
MKRKLKINELEIKTEIIDIIFRSSDDEKTKAENFQNNVVQDFNFAVVRQLEKFF